MKKFKVNERKETYLAVDLLELWVVLVHLEVKFRGRDRDNTRSHDTGRDQFSFRADVHRAWRNTISLYRVCTTYTRAMHTCK